MKWMNAAAAASSYPTDGRGGVTATAGSSLFLKNDPRKACILVGMIVNPGTADGTVTITGHDGSATPLAAINVATIADNVPSFWVNLHNVQTLGLKVVCAGAACNAIVFFETGQTTSY